MSSAWHDVTIPMHPNMTVWPGDPVFTFEAAARMDAGSSCNTSSLQMCTHTGTHCDAPWHFIQGGATLEQVDVALFFGNARIIEIPNADVIDATLLPPEPLPPRILFKTRNSLLPVDGTFDKSFVALAPDAAERIIADGVRLVGVDYLSVAPYGNSKPVHRLLLGAGVFIVEGLRLADIPAGFHEFIVLPLPIIGADGAPCRAFTRV